MNARFFWTLCLLSAPFAPLGCDLPMKDLGNETDSAGDAASQGDGMGDDGACEEGDIQDDGCNTCSCLEGSWSCTDRACPDPTGGDPEPECEPGDTRLADDGCNTCGCTEDGFWACTQIGCGSDTGSEPLDPDPFDDAAIEQCAPTTPTDPVDIAAVSLDANTMTVELGYGGGCAEHLLGLCWTGEFLESAPVQINAYVAHDSTGDSCEAYLSETREFDLQPLADAYLETYGGDQGAVSINLEGWNSGLLYEF